MSERLQTTVTVASAQGLHLRPAALICKLAKNYECEVSLLNGAVRADAKSVISLLSLVAGPGARLIVEAEGPDASAALAALEQLFADGFGERTLSPPPTSTSEGAV